MIQPENIRKKLFSLTGPIFIETLLVLLLGTVDTVMLSRYSDDTVAAVGVVNQLLNLVFLIFGVTTAGTSVLCSQYMGARQQKSVIHLVGVSLLFNTLIGLSISALLFFGSGGLLRLMGLDDTLIGYGISYMRIVGGFAFLQAVSLTLGAVLRSAGKAYYPMRITLVINILNIIGNYTLIFGKFGMPEMGVEGAALSTTISRSVAMLLLIFVLFRKVITRFPLTWFRPFPVDKLRNLLKIGMPFAGEQITYSLSQVVITYFINMLGNEALTARTYAMNIIMFTYLFTLSIAQAGAICIGHLIGRGQPNAAFLLGKYCLRMSIVISLSIAVLSAIFGRSIIGLLTKNPEIIRIGAIVLVVDIVLELGRTVNIFATNSLTAAGDAVYPFKVGLIVIWGGATALSWVFGIYFGMGLVGMWVAFTMDENIRAYLLLRRWNSKKWKGINFLLLKVPSGNA